MRRRRWFRDPTLPIPRGEITRFPHGVLEVKLSLPEGQKAPEWVQDLLDSGYLTEARARPATPGCCRAVDSLLCCSACFHGMAFALLAQDPVLFLRRLQAVLSSELHDVLLRERLATTVAAVDQCSSWTLLNGGAQTGVSYVS